MAIQGGVLSDIPSEEMHSKGSKRKSSPGGDRRRKERRHDERELEDAQDEPATAAGEQDDDTAAAPDAEAGAAGQEQQTKGNAGADDAENVEPEGAARTDETSNDNKQTSAAADAHPGGSRPPSRDAQATPDRRGVSSEIKRRLYGKRTSSSPLIGSAHLSALSQLLRGGRAQSPSEQAGGSPGGLRATGLQRTARIPPLHVKRRSPPPPRPKIPKKEDKKAEELSLIHI